MHQCPILQDANNSIQKITNENNKLKELIKQTVWYVKVNSHANVRDLVLYMLEAPETKVEK